MRGEISGYKPGKIRGQLCDTGVRGTCSQLGAVWTRRDWSPLRLAFGGAAEAGETAGEEYKRSTTVIATSSCEQHGKRSPPSPDGTRGLSIWGHKIALQEGGRWARAEARFRLEGYIYWHFYDCQIIIYMLIYGAFKQLHRRRETDLRCHRLAFVSTSGRISVDAKWLTPESHLQIQVAERTIFRPMIVSGAIIWKSAFGTPHREGPGKEV